MRNQKKMGDQTAVCWNTKNVVCILLLTFSALTPLGRVNFCSKTLVLVPPASCTSCLAVITMVSPSTFTSRHSGL